MVADGVEEGIDQKMLRATAERAVFKFGDDEEMASMTDFEGADAARAVK